LDALSGLRFLAVAWVVVRHLGEPSFEHMPFVFERCRRHAFLLMPLFFVLSGFVLAYVYGEPIRSGRLDKRTFWVSRLARVWPVYLVALSLRFVVDARMNAGVPFLNAAGAVSQAFLVQAWTPPLTWFGNAPGWTVSVEVFCYLLFPSLVTRVANMSVRNAVLLAAFAWVLGMVPPTAYSLLRPDGWPPAESPSPLFLDLLRFLPPLHLPSFLIGIVTARIYAEDRAVGRRRSGSLLTVVSLVAIAFTFAAGFERIAERGGIELWLFPYGHNGLLSPVWALLILGIAHGGARWLGARPFVRLGDASYGLYILHFPFYDAVITFAVRDWNRTPYFLAQIFLVLVPLTVVSFERFEQPVRAALMKRWSARLVGSAGSAREVPQG
jgi:peptidoglycan/LPS O-acetylase OafA/YrhL